MRWRRAAVISDNKRAAHPNLRQGDANPDAGTQQPIAPSRRRGAMDFVGVMHLDLDASRRSNIEE
jgi:hypothetical protein